MLLLAALALAHIPHDQVVALNVPPDLSTTQPWQALMQPNQLTQEVFQSNDGGYTWTAVFIDPTSERLLGGGTLDDGTMTWGSMGTLWWSTDQGVTWSETEFPPLAMDVAAAGSLAWFASSSGLYSLAPGATPTQHVTTAIASVEAEGEDVAALDSTGDVWAWNGTAFEERVKPGALPLTAVSPDGTYAGTNLGVVYRWTGSRWARCGAFPTYGTAGTKQGILRLLEKDGHLVALNQSGGPAVSVDQCATWTDMAAPEQPQYTYPGGVRFPSQAFTTLHVDGAHWLIGGWMGLYETLDAGVTWRDTEPMGPDISGTFATTAREDAEAGDYLAEDETEGGCAAGAAGVLPVLVGLGLGRRRRRA